MTDVDLTEELFRFLDNLIKTLEGMADEIDDIKYGNAVGQKNSQEVDRLKSRLSSFKDQVRRMQPKTKGEQPAPPDKPEPSGPDKRTVRGG